MTKTVAFLLRDLGIGGVQRQFLELAAALQARRNFSVLILSAYGGVLETELQKRRIPYQILSKAGRWDFFPFLFRLRDALRQEQVDILYGSHFVQNIWAFLMKMLSPGLRLVFGFRNTGYDQAERNLSVRMVEFFEFSIFRYSKTPIIVNSRKGYELLIQKRVPPKRIRLLFNGINSERAKFSFAGREDWRNRLTLGEEDILIGSVSSGRVSKGLESLLQVVLELRREEKLPLHVLLVGPDAVDQRRLLFPYLHDPQSSCIHIFPFQSQIAACLSAMDIFVLNARAGEGTSNALLEALCCLRPCIATDVGDAKEILLSDGIILPPDNSDLLKRALQVHCRSSEIPDAQPVRDSILSRYSLTVLAEETEKIFQWISCD